MSSIKKDQKEGKAFLLYFRRKSKDKSLKIKSQRENSKDEDDGYLVSIITDVNNKSSSCILFDAKNIQNGPICSMRLPQQICSGTHATWAQMSEIYK